MEKFRNDFRCLQRQDSFYPLVVFFIYGLEPSAQARKSESSRPNSVLIPFCHRAILSKKAFKERWGMVHGYDKVKTPQVDDEESSMAQANYA